MKPSRILFSFIFIFMISKVTAQVGLGAFAIGTNQVFDRANQLIQQFQNAGLVLEVNAASQVLTVVGNIQVAYENELKSTSAVMSAQQQQLISGLNATLDKIQNHILTNLTQNIQQIANTIPFSNKFPQLSSFAGNIVSPSMANVLVTLNGNFFDLANNGYDAIIKIGQDSYVNATKTTNAITFNIPKDKIVNPLTNQVQYEQFNIAIPYQQTVVLVFSRKKIANFLLNFIVLPTNAGTYELVINRLVDQTNTISKTCSNRIWDSSDDDIDKVDGCPVDPGWTINVESVVPHAVHAEGDIHDFGNASNLTFAGWHYKTAHHRFGTSGKLNISLSYTESQVVKVPQTLSQGIVPISWGDTPVLTYDSTVTWTLIYHEFDGKTIQFSTTNNDNPYFKVNNIGNHIQINTVP